MLSIDFFVLCCIGMVPGSHNAGKDKPGGGGATGMAASKLRGVSSMPLRGATAKFLCIHRPVPLPGAANRVWYLEAL